MARLTFLEPRDRRRVDLASPLSPGEARHAVRSGLAGDHYWLGTVFPQATSVVTGWVQDPAFQLIGTGPRRRLGPLRLPPRLTRRLRGTITAEPGGGSQVEARLVAWRWFQIVLTGRTLRQEAELRAWLVEVLEAGAVEAPGV